MITVRFYELENRIRILNLQVMIVGNSNGNDIAMDTCNKLIKLAEDSTALEIGNFGKSSSWLCSNHIHDDSLIRGLLELLSDDLIMPSSS